MSTAVRINGLTLRGPGPMTLASMEAHGKRLDATAAARRVRDVPPLVHGTLDLDAAFGRHTEGVRASARLRKPVRHAIVQFPTAAALPEDPAAAEPVQRRMLEAAVDFFNSRFGGPGLPSVFAARMDRDEAGRHTADVFFTPKFIKTTKARGPEVWISTTRHAKQLCRRHRAEIERRHGGKFSDGPRQMGIALQSEWREYFAAIAPEFGLGPASVAPKHEKRHGGPDRLEPEAFKARRDLDRASQAAADAAIADAREERRRRRALEQRLIDLCAERKSLGIRQIVKAARLEKQIAALEAELKPLRERAHATDALAAEPTREDRDEQAGNDARAAELDRREKDLDAEAARRGDSQAAAWADTFDAAGVLIADEIMAPGPSPGEWRKAARYDETRWAAAKKRQPALEWKSWPGRMWEALRGLAARLAAPLRRAAEAKKETAELKTGSAALAEARDQALARAVAAEEERDARTPWPLERGLRSEVAGIRAHLGAVTGSVEMIRIAALESGEIAELSARRTGAAVSSARPELDLPMYPPLGPGGPLHLAVRRGRPEIVRELLAAGADPEARDDRGRTAAELARDLLAEAAPDRARGLKSVLAVLQPQTPSPSPGPGW